MTRSIFVYMHLLVCFSCFRASTENEKIDPRKIHLVFYNCNATDEISITCLIEDIDCIQNVYDEIKKDKHETTVYIHGYVEHKNTIHKNTIPVQYIVSAYCSGNISVIAIIDWSQLATSDVMVIANRLPEVGKIIASTFNSLNNRGYEISKWHVIGHSMGAHIAGCIGTYSNFTFLHITGLDPAGPVFYSDMYNGCRINPNVAHFTDVFYTDRGVLGASIDTGSLNIYANFGTSPQPGCCLSLDIHKCGHIKAVEWYADAVRHEIKYLATKCMDCVLFQRYGYCQKNDTIYLGPHTDMEATGLYCLPIY